MNRSLYWYDLRPVFFELVLIYAFEPPTHSILDSSSLRSYLYGAAARGSDDCSATPLSGYGVGCLTANK